MSLQAVLVTFPVTNHQTPIAPHPGGGNTAGQALSGRVSAISPSVWGDPLPLFDSQSGPVFLMVALSDDPNKRNKASFKAVCARPERQAPPHRKESAEVAHHLSRQRDGILEQTEDKTDRMCSPPDWLNPWPSLSTYQLLNGSCLHPAILKTLFPAAVFWSCPRSPNL